MRHSRWLIAAVCVIGPIGHGTSQTAYHSRNLTPQHRSQLQAEINQVESQLGTTGNSKNRGPLQQELCKKLIQIEDYDRALRVAQDVYLDQTGDKERRAAHHYLIADIYAQKMKASPSTELMAQNRRLAYQSAQSVVSQKYPSKWGAGECAQKLLNDLQDPKYMGDVQEWVQKRSSNGCDTDQVNLARSQRNALESGAGRKSNVASRGMSAFRRTGSNLMGVFGRNETVTQAPSTKNPVAFDWSRQNSAPGAASQVNIPGAGQVTFSQAQPGMSTASSQRTTALPATAAPRAPIIIDGTSVRRTNPIATAVDNSKLPSVMETYAAGQAPMPGVVKN